MIYLQLWQYFTKSPVSNKIQLTQMLTAWIKAPIREK